MKIKLGILIAFCAAANGCSSIPDAAEDIAPTVTPNASAASQSAIAYDSERIAGLLAEADDAARAGNMKLLAYNIRSLDLLGAQILAGEDNDPMPVWRSLAATELAKLPPFRGRTLGPAYKRGMLASGQAMKLEQSFLAGQRARVSVASRAEAAVLLSVADSKQKFLCDRGQHCGWVPIFTQHYNITLTNQGKSQAFYYLVID